MEKVLVLLATYNGEKYLQEQLDSIYEQKGVEVSVLARDDGSSDCTCEILEKNKKEHNINWYTGMHLNVQKGFFDLMQKAKEFDVEYIAFCDQDDVWDSDKLYIAVQNLKKYNTNLPALYYSGQRLVNEKQELIANHELNKNRTLVTRFVLSDFAGCTGVFNKALLNEVIKFEPDYMLMHDSWILKVCLCLGGNVCVDSEPHMNYRQHGGNSVGLGRSLPAYLKQVKQYLNEYQVERQMHELLRGYESYMVAQYKEIAIMICEYRKHRSYKRKLLDKRLINFYNRGLNLTYDLKVLLNKL